MYAIKCLNFKVRTVCVCVVYAIKCQNFKIKVVCVCRTIVILRNRKQKCPSLNRTR